jgi:short-subunit dehydrogenase
MNIIVTGASRGIGYDLVKQFAGNGNHHVIAIARNKEKLQQLVRECEEINNQARVMPIALDLVKILDNPGLLTDKSIPMDHIDILINNAGNLIKKAFINSSISEAYTIFNINFFVPAFIVKKLMIRMGNKKTTHIVNIGSMSGFQGSSKYPGLSYYSASKAALAAFTECLSAEFKDLNIRVNCLSLGATQTEMFHEAFPGHKASLSAAEMATFIADFALNGHKYFNGKIIPVSISNP